MNIGIRLKVAGRGDPVSWSLPDQPFVPRVGDEIFITSSTRPATTVTHVELRWQLNDCVVTLSDVEPMSDEEWKDLHAALALHAPTPAGPSVIGERPFDPAADGMRKGIRTPRQP
jgi:hypothetical protein